VEELAAVLAIFTERISTVDSEAASLLIRRCRDVNRTVTIDDICAALRRELNKPGAKATNPIGWVMTRVPQSIRRELLEARRLAQSSEEWEKRNRPQ